MLDANLPDPAKRVAWNLDSQLVVCRRAVCSYLTYTTAKVYRVLADSEEY